MDVRRVEPDEFQKCIPLGQAFYDARNPGGAFDPHRFHTFWNHTYFFERGIIVGAFERDELKGMFGGVINDGVYDGLRQATEHFWWMPKGGMTAVRLVRFFEEWAKHQGAYAHYIGHFADTPKVGLIYQSLGYTLLEHGYRKVL